MKSFSTIVAVAVVSGMVGAQSDKIIDAARFVVFAKGGQPAVVMTTDGIDAGIFAVYDNAGNEVFAVRGGRIINADLEKKLADLGAVGSQRHFDEVTTKQLNIVDANGKKRVVVGAGGAAGLVVLDDTGATRIAAAVKNGEATVTLSDGNGKTRAGLQVENRGGAGFGLFDTEGRDRVAMTTDIAKPGTSIISIHDINQARATLMYEESGIAALTLIGAAGDVRIMAAVSNDRGVFLPTQDLRGIMPP